VAPEDDEKVPASQEVQIGSPAWEVLPAGQLRHSVPSLLGAVPAPQTVHALESADGAALPGAQLWQLSAPGVE
jgi:hypothetical protein